MDETPRCQRCGAENLTGSTYCGACGRKFVARATPIAVEGEDGVYYCLKHKREPTRLRCGKCDAPICTRCAIIGPAGVRCKTCGRNKIKVRPRGVLHDVSSGVGGAVKGMGTRPIWYLWIFSFIARIFSSFFGRW